MIGGGNTFGIVKFPINGFVVKGTMQPQPCVILCGSMDGKNATASLTKVNAASCFPIAELFDTEADAVAQWKQNVLDEIARLSALTYP